MKKLKKVFGYPSKKLTTWINGPLKEFNNELIEAQKKIKIHPEESLEVLKNLIGTIKDFNADFKIKSNEVSIKILKENIVEICNLELSRLNIDHMFSSPQPIDFFLQLDKNDLRRKNAEIITRNIILDKVSHLMFLVSEIKKI